MTEKDKRFHAKLAKMKERYKCTLGNNGAWCDGEKRGSRMRCPFVLCIKDGSKACKLGI